MGTQGQLGDAEEAFVKSTLNFYTGEGIVFIIHLRLGYL